MKELIDLFFTFARIGGFTFGGGYAMLPMLQREVVESRHWATEDELADYYAIGQCTPGIIAVNTATFIGYRLRGIVGGIVATLGVISPSIVIITIISAFISNFSDLPIVAHAFGGIRACVCVLIFNAVVKLGKKALNSPIAIAIFIVVLGLTLFIPAISPIVLVVCAGIFGVVQGKIMPLPLGSVDAASDAADVTSDATDAASDAADAALDVADTASDATDVSDAADVSDATDAALDAADAASDAADVSDAADKKGGAK